MGKVRTRIIGIEDIEQKQKADQRKKRNEKQQVKKKTRAPGQKGGERMVTVEADQSAMEKIKKAEDLIKKTDTKEEGESEEKQKTKRKGKARKRGKKYQQAKKQVENKKYELGEAVKLLKKIKYASFDESIELHLKVGKAGLAGEVQLPNETGKKTRVVVMSDKILADIEAGKIEFDVLVTHPSYMPQLAKVAKVLGPRGLMPNPKTGNISQTPEDTAKKFQKGALRWKTEAKSPLIHQMVGKISQDDKALIDNTQSFLQSVGKQNIKNVYLKTTMSPALALDLEKI